MSLVLAGDVGGTKTDLALVRTSDGAPLREARFASGDFDSLEAVVREFLADGGEAIAAAAFAVAGPVLGDPVRLTNLPWQIERAALSRALDCPRVQLLNDLAATAYGALFLPADRLATLNAGVPRDGHRAVIAAGTGLGQALLFRNGDGFEPVATEGGHAAFAPRDEQEMALLRFLQRDHPRVSWERVLSGPGLAALLAFLRAEGRPLADATRARLEREDPAAVIGELGTSGECPTCREAVDWFVSLYGAQAANLVLTAFALGGLYVAGGIGVKLRPRLEAGGFLAAFRDAGRFGDLLAEVPVELVLDPRTALHGAAALATELAR